MKLIIIKIKKYYIKPINNIHILLSIMISNNLELTFNQKQINDELIYNLINKYHNIMYLKIYIDNKDDKSNILKTKYKEAAIKHNTNLMEPNSFIDAGFDLFYPTPYILQNKDYMEEQKLVNNKLVQKLDMKVKCAACMITFYQTSVYPTGFYMYPRSSLSKRKLRLANSVGIIDSGYRGNLMGMFDIVNSNEEYEVVNKFDRLVQICSPNLQPIIVEIVDELNELGEITQRGEGGFGSTGK